MNATASTSSILHIVQRFGVVLPHEVFFGLLFVSIIASLLVTAVQDATALLIFFASCLTVLGLHRSLSAPVVLDHLSSLSLPDRRARRVRPRPGGFPYCDTMGSRPVTIVV
ncbi:MAG: hypothetical protein WA208_03700 [Thermoanaerobaculia bacterium]